MYEDLGKDGRIDGLCGCLGNDDDDEAERGIVGV